MANVLNFQINTFENGPTFKIFITLSWQQCVSIHYGCHHLLLILLYMDESIRISAQVCCLHHAMGSIVGRVSQKISTICT